MRGEKKKNETQRGELDLCFGFFSLSLLFLNVLFRFFFLTRLSLFLFSPLSRSLLQKESQRVWGFVSFGVSCENANHERIAKTLSRKKKTRAFSMKRTKRQEPQNEPDEKKK